MIIVACLVDKDSLKFSCICFVLRESLSSLKSHANPVSLDNLLGISGLLHHFQLWEVSWILRDLNNVKVLSSLLLPDARAVLTLMSAVNGARKPFGSAWSLQHSFVAEFTFPKTNLVCSLEEYTQYTSENSEVVVRSSNVSLPILYSSQNVLPMIDPDISMCLRLELCPGNLYSWAMYPWSDAMNEESDGVLLSASLVWYGSRSAIIFEGAGNLNFLSVQYINLNMTGSWHQKKLKRALEHGEAVPCVVGIWKRVQLRE